MIKKVETEVMVCDTCGSERDVVRCSICGTDVCPSCRFMVQKFDIMYFTRICLKHLDIELPKRYIVEPFETK